MQTSETIRKALRGVKDPELNLNIIDIGLVYDVEINDAGANRAREDDAHQSRLPRRSGDRGRREALRRGPGGCHRVRGGDRLGAPTGPRRRWTRGCGPSWRVSGGGALPVLAAGQQSGWTRPGSHPLTCPVQRHRFLLPLHLQRRHQPAPDHLRCQRRMPSTWASSSTPFGSSRAIASSRPLGQSTPGASGSSPAIRLRSCLSRSSRASYGQVRRRAPGALELRDALGRCVHPAAHRGRRSSPAAAAGRATAP